MNVDNFAITEEFRLELNDRLGSLDALDVLKEAILEFGEKVTFVTGFGSSGVVLLHMLYRLLEQGRIDQQPEILTIDTGRLPEETYELIQEFTDRFGLHISLIGPDQIELGKLLKAKGPMSFRQSVSNRRECCRIRKVLPLKRALVGQLAWISGVRHDQSDARLAAEVVEIDQKRGRIFKINPLVSWSEEMIQEYIKTNNVPYNKLYDLGYQSIGCAPCTRSVKPGEHKRSGRWWWEENNEKECGLHGYCEIKPR